MTSLTIAFLVYSQQPNEKQCFEAVVVLSAKISAARVASIKPCRASAIAMKYPRQPSSDTVGIVEGDRENPNVLNRSTFGLLVGGFRQPVGACIGIIYRTSNPKAKPVRQFSTAPMLEESWNPNVIL